MPAPTKTIADFIYQTPGGVGPDGRSEPYIQATPDGGFRIVATDGFNNGDPIPDVESNLYDAFGTSVTNTTSFHSETNDEASRQGSVTYLEDGRFVVVWDTATADGSGTDGRDIRAEVYYADGTIQTADFLVAGGTDNQMHASVVASADGGFAIAYVDRDGTDKISMKFYDQGNTLTTTVGTVNTTVGVYSFAADSQSHELLDTVALDNGNYLVAWTTSGFDVHAQIFTASGSTVGAEIIVTNGTTEIFPRLTALADGRFVVTHYGSFAIEAEIFNADGSLSVSKFTVGTNAQANLNSGFGDVAALQDGRFVVVWVDTSSEIKGRIFSADGTPDGDEFDVTSVTTGIQGRPTITTLADGRFAVAWETDETGTPEIKAAVFDPRETGIEYTGTRFDDTGVGTGFEDLMTGGRGDDNLQGGGASDHLFGGNGRDTLTGDDGDDFIFGGNDFDILQGGAGDDQLFGGIGPDILDGGADNDTLFGGQGRDTMNGGSGIDTASYEFSTRSVTADLLVSANGTNDAFGETFANIENLTGTQFADVLFGDGGSGATGLVGVNHLIGGDGDDQLYGRGGNDTLQGDSGADLLSGGDGFDFATYISATSGVTVDLILSNTNTNDAHGDTLSSIEGIIGSKFDDILLGTNGVEHLIGGDGNDGLFGRGGDDILIGGKGADILGGSGGNDTASYETAQEGVEADIIVIGTNKGDARGDTYSGIENFTGSSFGDTLLMDNGNNIIIGGDGDDFLFARGGTDTLFGGQGNDVLNGGSGGGDVAAYTGGNAADYTLLTLTNGWTRVTENATGDFDTLIDIEIVRFDDGDIIL